MFVFSNPKVYFFCCFYYADSLPFFLFLLFFFPLKPQYWLHLAIYNLGGKSDKTGLGGVCFQQRTWSCRHRKDYRAMICVKREIPSTVLLMSVLKQKLYTWGQWIVVFISILFYAVLWSNMKIIAIYEIRQQTRPRGVLRYVTLHPIHYFVTLFLKQLSERSS